MSSLTPKNKFTQKKNSQKQLNNFTTKKKKELTILFVNQNSLKINKNYSEFICALNYQN